MGKITREQAQRLDNEIGEDAIMDARAEGLSVRAITKKFNVTTRPLYSWLGNLTTARRAEVDGVCRRERWNEATQFAAEARASQADERLEVLLDPESGRMLQSVSREEVALAKALAEQDRWQAASMDPAFKNSNGAAAGGQPAATINIGQMFLQAVEAVKPVRRLELAPAPPAVNDDGEEDIEDAELVESDGPDLIEDLTREG